MSKQLKPCPLCGHEAKLKKHEWCISIECSYCPAYMGYYATKKEAIEAWNTWNRRVNDESKNA